MRLLQVDPDGSLTLTKDLTTPPAPYAILSHTWADDDEEVTFDDIEKKTGQNKMGYTKLRFCIDQAKIDGLQYCWVDTCCINKASHTELDKAIRCMFRWYYDAARCYVYLADVLARDSKSANNKNREWKTAFRTSRWFRRGWTLQELLAPRSVIFYSQEKEHLGTKASLVQLIQEITQIPAAALQDTPLSHFSSEERLRWAAKRETKEPEDKAYCLLGILDVSMSMRYGEGEKAFERLKAEIDKKMNLSPLKVVEGAAYDSYGQEHACCHPDTRRDLLQEIHTWSQQANAPPIFWLNGMAGTGKSTISRTVAEQLATADHSPNATLGASFFFKRGEGDRGSAALLFPTIVDQLATRIDGLRELVVQAIRDDPRICCKALGEQFKRLLDEPTRKLTRPSTHQRYIVVVDALDECEKEEDMRTILRLWSNWSTTGNMRLRLFVTSRPEVPIRLGFREMSGGHQVLVLHEVPQSILQHDIFVFFRDAFAKIRKDYNSEPLGDALDDHWPCEDTLKTLTNMAVPLFIVAATIFRYILGNPRPRRRLQEVLTSYESGHRSAIVPVYRLVLQTIAANMREEEISETYQIFRRVVGSIVSLAEPLSSSALVDLLAVSLEDVNICLRPLHAVLQVPTGSDGLIRPLHLSFGEYLTSTAAKTEPFGIDKEETNDILWKQCLRLLNCTDGLHENLCALSFPGQLRSEVSLDVVKRRFSPALRYACEYWVHHLKMSESMLRDNDEVHLFLQKHFLHWLEALSLLDRLSHVIEWISILQAKIMQDGASRRVSQFLDDAQRFAKANRYIGELAPLQLYSSAIIFAPQNSVVRNSCVEIPQWVRQCPKTKTDWGPEMQKLEGHTGSVNAVAFSPDGSRLASASDDGTVRLWDAGTGAEVQTLEGHTGSVTAVAFSPDGSRLVSASSDQTVRAWDTRTGAVVQKLMGHNNSVHAVVFLPNGWQLASVSSDRTIRLWDTRTGLEIHKLQLQIDSVKSVVFSYDGSQLASASSDCTVRIWDVRNGAEIQKLTGHTSWISQLVFTTNGFRLASASSDGTLRLWNIGTGAELLKLEHHNDGFWAVTFSLDGSRLSSASFGGQVQVWDVDLGVEIQTLEGHTTGVKAVAFSPDGSQLASASFDRTVRLWDTGTGTVAQPLQGNNSRVWVVAFSPNKSQLASASDDGTMRIWNAGTGAGGQMLEGHSSTVTALTFSPNGSQLASASSDQTIRMWDTSTGMEIQTLEGHTGSVTAVAFSPNGSRLASASSDQTIRVWDTIRGAEIQTLEGHTSWISQVAFMPCGFRLVSASFDCTVRLWDASTGLETHKLEGHTQGFWAMAVSSDGSRLASSSLDGTVRVWDIGTGVELHNLELANATQLRFLDRVTLITNQGGVNLCTRSAIQTTPQLIQNDRWIEYCGRRVLWLPHEYRYSVTTVVDDMIAIDTGLGAVGLIRLDLSHLSSSLDKNPGS